jgi:hypothetical protein
MFFYLYRRFARRRGGRSVRSAEPPAPQTPRPSAGELGRSDLADETEAFFQGTLAELRAANRGSLAAWMVLNRICHGDSVELYDAAAGDVARAPMPGVSSAYHHMWNAAQRTVALRVLEAAHDAAEIRQLQHDVLVPLELQLVARSRNEPLTFVQVVDATIEALDHRQIDH